MADSPETEQKPTISNTHRVSLPTVLCTTESNDDNSDISIKVNSIISSDSKMSLPSNLGTPTSPLRLSSPLSLPSSPCVKDSPQSTNSLPNPNAKPMTSSTSSNKTVVNSGSATGNPRNKCALQPGHSLMDWIRLGNSGKDLTGVGGRIRPVTPAELSTHNTTNDAWLAIRGRVYNITHYLPYHPGGPEELMRGAGMDATQLFDKVHPWVNYDSLLAKCLVGPLRFDLPDAEELFDTTNPSPKSDRLREPSKAQELVRKSMENLANCITPVRKKITKSDDNSKGSPPSKIMQSLIQSADLPMSISRRAASSPVKKTDKSPDSPVPLRHDWIQTSTKLTISVYTGHLANPGGCARITEGFLLIEVATNGWLRTLKIKPEAKLKEPLQLRVFAESGKIEITALKVEPSVWKGCGEVTLGAASRVSSPRTVECRVMEVSRVSHDTSLLSVCPRAGPVVVPLGHHVRVHRRVEGSECVRSYTPVGEGWGPPDGTEIFSALRLAVKRYDSGVLSPHLTALKVGDLITLSGPYGNFQLQKLKAVKTLYLIAAGTGITPMLGLIKFMMSRSNPRCERTHLLFFNKTEADILFRDNFEEMAKEDDRLKITHVLSDASSSWSGHKGRIRDELLTEVLGETTTQFTAQWSQKYIEPSTCVGSNSVGEGWGPPDGTEIFSALRLAVKRYDSGVLSPHLTALKVGDLITLSGPYGNFQLQKLKAVKTLYLIAAGTGITPMLGLIKFMMSRSNPRCERTHLLFFNKTEADILFRDNFEEMAKEDDRLKITHVLSDASSSWSGHKGRIRDELLTEVLGEVKCDDKCSHYACLCGPTEFTYAGLDLLKKHGFKDDCLHAFMG